MPSDLKSKLIILDKLKFAALYLALALFFANCNENKTMILDMVREQQQPDNPITNEMVEEIITKLKKTYKNRFYNIRVALHN